MKTRGKILLNYLIGRKNIFLLLVLSVSASIFFSFISGQEKTYLDEYYLRIGGYIVKQKDLLQTIRRVDIDSQEGIREIKVAIDEARIKLKGIDFWLRYLEPNNYRKINNPIPVEWELEPFEKFRRPLKREGAGLTLAEMYLAENNISRDSLDHLVKTSIDSMEVYKADSVIKPLFKPDHFFFANRLYLLNLAAIYTTGFECPDTGNILPELVSMIEQVKNIYTIFDQSFPDYYLTNDYLLLYDKMYKYVKSHTSSYENFDHYIFIKDYVNPLFAINQKMITKYKVVSRSINDIVINNNSNSIFNKQLFECQNPKGIYWDIEDPKLLSEIREIGKLLFYDPLLSGNTKRSCASCHVPKQYFTDTTTITSLNFDRINVLPRNTPSLIKSIYNPLLMLDGRHASQMLQLRDVTTNRNEMGGYYDQILSRVLSCDIYSKALHKFAGKTPFYPKVDIEHIFSSVIFYYSSFSYYDSRFDGAINNKTQLNEESVKGFNLFMGKARCGMCHYAPQFNGVKPPFIDTEFEVLGTPGDKGFKGLGSDKGRFDVFPEYQNEMAFAWRTPTVRNTIHTKPYMHNGVFATMEEVIDFYDTGGGSGRGLNVQSQTLAADSLRLTKDEKHALIEFIKSLTEKIIFEEPPLKLPFSNDSLLNSRIVGGEY